MEGWINIYRFYSYNNLKIKDRPILPQTDKYNPKIKMIDNRHNDRQFSRQTATRACMHQCTFAKSARKNQFDRLAIDEVDYRYHFQQ